MWLALGAAVDLLHALLMAAWFLGFPLLFMRSRPRLRAAYSVYAIAFVVISQVSQLVLGECIFTTIARVCWQHGAPQGSDATAPDEWFTVRLAQLVFHMTPSHKAIAVLSEALYVATAAAVLVSVLRHGRHARAIRTARA